MRTDQPNKSSSEENESFPWRDAHPWLANFPALASDETVIGSSVEDTIISQRKEPSPSVPSSPLATPPQTDEPATAADDSFQLAMDDAGSGASETDPLAFSSDALDGMFNFGEEPAVADTPFDLGEPSPAADADAATIDLSAPANTAPAVPLSAQSITESGSHPSLAQSATAEVFGPYKLLKRLPNSLTGELYKALHTRLDRKFTILVLDKQQVRNEVQVERFQQAVKALGHLEHLHIAQHVDAGQCDERYYLAMEHISGADLQRQYQDRGPFSVPLACQCLRQTALALAHGHRQGLVHGDLRASHLLVDRQGVLKLTRFGMTSLLEELAHDAEAPPVAESSGEVNLASIPSTEQRERWATQRHTVRTDLQALGQTACELLAAGPASLGELTRRRSDLPPALLQLLERALSTTAEPTLSAAEFAAQLVPFCSSTTTRDSAIRRQASPTVATAPDLPPAEYFEEPSWLEKLGMHSPWTYIPLVNGLLCLVIGELFPPWRALLFIPGVVGLLQAFASVAVWFMRSRSSRPPSRTV